MTDPAGFVDQRGLQTLTIERRGTYPGFTPEERGFICEQILGDVARGMLVKRACLRAGLNRNTFHEWALWDRELGDLYARAREMQASAMADETVEISDGVDDQSRIMVEEMYELLQGVDEEYREDILNAYMAAKVQRDRLRVDTRKWMTSKIAPRTFGDKVQHDVTERRTVVFLPEPGLVEARKQTSTFRQIAEASAAQADQSQELEGYEYVDVDETPDEARVVSDPDLDPAPVASAPQSLEAAILARRRNGSSGNGSGNGNGKR